MLPVVWRSSARAELAEIIRYIANEDPQAARRLKERLGRVPGTREVVAHPNYVLVYRVAANCIEVVNVLHARQQYPC